MLHHDRHHPKKEQSMYATVRTGMFKSGSGIETFEACTRPFVILLSIDLIHEAEHYLPNLSYLGLFQERYGTSKYDTPIFGQIEKQCAEPHA